MNFGTSRASAIDNLNRFVDQNLFEYSKLRNFDYGPDNRSNISCLSPYITHGVVSELEVIKKSLSKFSFSKNEKFIQEVLWRTYWKGWLELRPNVWTDYFMMRPSFVSSRFRCFSFRYSHNYFSSLITLFI